MSITSNFLLLENTALNLKLNLCLFVIVLSSKEEKKSQQETPNFYVCICLWTTLATVSQSTIVWCFETGSFTSPVFAK